MSPKWKGAAAEDKIEAPPAKTTKGEKKIKSEKTPSELPDQGTSGGTAAFEPLEKPVEGTSTRSFDDTFELMKKNWDFKHSFNRLTAEADEDKKKR